MSGTVKDDGVPSAEQLQAEYEQALARHQAEQPAASTLMAAEFLERLGDARRFNDWLEEHSVPIRKAIVRHLERKRGRR